MIVEGIAATLHQAIREEREPSQPRFRPKPTHRVIAALLALVCLAPPAAAARRRAADHQARLAAVERVFIVVLENTDAAVAETLPFVKRLAARGAILRNYEGIGHPSQPNYIALVSGSTQGVTASGPVTIDARHIGDLLDFRGVSWKVYAENYPGNCFLGETFGTVEEGQYVRRHVPFLSFRNVQQNPARCNARIVNATAFDADLATGALPRLAFYIPDDRHNGHDTSPFFADNWADSRFGPLLDDPRFTAGTLFIVMYDESLSQIDNRTIALFAGPMVKAGVESTQHYTHYNLLRTLENLHALGTLGAFDETAAPITGIWK